MDITEAYKVLDKYYTKTDLKGLYRSKKFDGSEYDTIRKHEYNGELLRKEAGNVKDKDEHNRLIQAANCFENLARKEEWNR